MMRFPCILMWITTCACSVNVPVRRWVPPWNASDFNTESNGAYRAETAALEANHTALVMVDVWDTTDEVLLDNYKNRLLPLLAEARKLGFLIIHAPSQGPLLSSITVEPGELLVTGEDGTPGASSRCDVAMHNSGREIHHVLLAGYDTNMCMIDKPCGSVSLSLALHSNEVSSRNAKATYPPSPIEVILLRDVTRPQSRYYSNTYYTTLLNVHMIESAPWLLPRPSTLSQHKTLTPINRGIRSAVLSDLLEAFNAKVVPPLQPCAYPVPDASHSNPSTSAAPEMDSRTAFVLVSAADDFANNGFQARVQENVIQTLTPLLHLARASPVRILHIPNGHHIASAVTPKQGEMVVENDSQMTWAIQAYSIRTLIYCGYPSNVDVMWGTGGIAKWYAASRYLKQSVPQVYWLADCTLALETAESMEDQWAKKEAIAYRQTDHVLGLADVTARLCAAAAKQNSSSPSSKNGVPFFTMGPERRFNASLADVLVDEDISGAGGLCGGIGSAGMLGHPNVTITLSFQPSSLEFAAMYDRKLLCFAKSTGTPFAVYQLKVSTTNTPGGKIRDLMYQTNVNGQWHTLVIPSAFAADGDDVVHFTLTHSGTAVAAYVTSPSNRTSLLVAVANFTRLDYSNAVGMAVGGRPGDPKDVWNGTIANVSIRAGVFPPHSGGGGGNTSRPLLATAERAVLEEMYRTLGGENWRYTAGTDVYNGNGRWLQGDPCADRWFGVLCDAECNPSTSTDGSCHVVGLFPNTRNSGNPLIGRLPNSISQLSRLEHLYTSNDVSQSYLSSSIPESVGTLSELRCMYFSHNNLSGTIPRSLQSLTKLEAFLMRANQLTGSLIDFSNLTALKNVWFDGQQLTGGLGSLSGLKNLTLLHASNNLLSGPVPSHLCHLSCFADGNSNLTCPSKSGCCEVDQCGGKTSPTPAPDVTPSMGVCYPQ